jgi:sporulation protein YlmC with PRC-barrel domain
MGGGNKMKKFNLFVVYCILLNLIYFSFFIPVVFGADSSIYESGSDEWWMYGGDSAYTRYTNANSPLNISNTTVRTVALPRDVDNAPVIVGEELYIIADDYYASKAYKVNALNVSEILQISSNSYDIILSFVYYNNHLYCKADNYLYQINMSNLSQVLDSEYIADSTGWYGAPTAYNGSIYASAGNYGPYIREFNSSNISQILSSYYIYSRPYQSVVVRGENAYTAVSGTLLQLNSSNLAQKIASRSCADSSSSFFTAGEDYVYVSCDVSSVPHTFQLNASNISQQFTNISNGNNYYRGGPALANGYFYFAQGNILYQKDASNISIEIANFTLGASVSSTPIVTDDYVFIGAGNKMYQVHANNVGNYVGSFTAGSTINGAPVVSKGFLYFGSIDDNLYQLGTYNPLAAIEISYPIDEEIYLNVTDINYALSGELSIDSCWYSNDSGVWNSESVVAGINFTNLISIVGSNSWTVYCNDSDNNIYNANVDFAVDSLYPSFGLIENQTLQQGNTFSYAINASDDLEFSCFSVNDSVNFNIDCSGNLLNNSLLGIGLYWLNITINDSVGHESSELMFVNVTPRSIIGLELVSPTGNINVTQNEFFEVSVNVSCLQVDCGEINVTLDPALDSTPRTCSGVWGASCVGSDPSTGDYSYDGCAAGSYYSTGFWVDEAIVNASVVALGDTIKITCDYDCYSSSSLNDLAIMYYNGTWNKIWRQDDECTDGNYSVDVVVSGDIGEQYARCSIGYNNYPNDAADDVCFDTTYSDNDDVNFTVIESTKSGTISMIVGDTPFYTNGTNPYNLLLDAGDFATITWWVNVTGELGTTHRFFVYANQTSDQSINDMTSIWNVTISDTTPPVINITYPQETTYGRSISELNYTYSDSNAGSCWYSKNDGGTNSSAVSAGTNFESMGGTGGANTWTLYCNDSLGNKVSDFVTFMSTIPVIGLDWIYPTRNINVVQNEFFNVRVNVSCTINDCGEINVTLDPEVETVYNFTDCGASGRTGPLQANCDSTYSGTTLEGLVGVGAGIQNWTVPATGTYTIEVLGAEGGCSGGADGAKMMGDFELIVGDVLQILVGQEGECISYGGGGGGSFVARGANYSIADPLIVAGGGGGMSSSGTAALAGVIGINGTDGQHVLSSNKGVNGSGGYTGGGSYSGGGGGGFYGDGTSSTRGGKGFGFINGGVGGTSTNNGAGGFGGGAGNGWYGGGGAGGYSGGGGGYTDGDGGGGGGSFNDGANQNNTAGVNTGDGYITITFTAAGAKSGTISMIVGDTPFYTNVTNPYDLSLNKGESEIITWNVNATGDVNLTHKFFVYANRTSDETSSNMTNVWNITIVDFDVDYEAPEIELFSHIDNSGADENISFEYNVSDLNNISNCFLIINGEINQINSSVQKSSRHSFNLFNLNSTYYVWSINCTDEYNNSRVTSPRRLSIVKKSRFLGSTTNLSSVDLNNISNLVIDSPNFGIINFTQEVNLSLGADFNSYLNISQNRIELNSINLSVLNVSARLRLYNLSFVDPQILKDEVVCGDCVEESYSSGTLIFNVSGFSVYSARETPATITGDAGESTGGSGGGGGGVKYECIVDKDCDNGDSCYAHKCVKLFDIEILNVPSIVEDFNFNLSYFMKGMAEFNGDVFINYWLENEYKKIDLGQDVIYLGSFEQKLREVNLNLPINSENQTYDLYVSVSYENYSAESFRKINIVLNKDLISNIRSKTKSENVIPFWVWIVLVFILLFIFTKKKKGTSNEKVWVRVENNVGEEVKEEEKKEAEQIKETFVESKPKKLIPITHKFKIKFIRRIRRINGNICLSTLGEKEVYATNGNKIGRIEKSVLSEGKVHGWVINLDKKFNFNKKVLIKHCDVKSIGDIFIVDEEIERYLISSLSQAFL